MTTVAPVALSLGDKYTVSEGEWTLATNVFALALSDTNTFAGGFASEPGATLGQTEITSGASAPQAETSNS